MSTAVVSRVLFSWCGPNSLPLSAAEVHPCFPATVTRHDAPEIGGGRASQGHACGRVYYFQRYPVVKRAQLAPQLPWCASTRAALARALLLEARSSENSSGHLGALQLTAVEEIGYAIIFEWASARTARSYDDCSLRTRWLCSNKLSWFLYRLICVRLVCAIRTMCSVS